MEEDSGGTAASEAQSPGGATPTSQAQEPPPPPRQNLVELAIKFLNNPRVAERPMQDKKAFLKKKGLTDAEIDLAVTKTTQEPHTPSPAATTASLAPPPLPPRPLTPPHHHTPQSRSWTEYALTAALLGGVGYAVIHFVKNYVIPWFTAPRAQEARQLEEIQASVNQLQSTVSETITSVAESTRSVQELLAEQQQHMQLLTSQVTGLQAAVANDQPLRQLREELGSLKGILLSRHQFPPTPTRGGTSLGGGGAGGIPTWQRAAVSQDTAKKQGEEQGEEPGEEPEAKGNRVIPEENGNGTVLENGTGEENSPDED